MKKSSVVALCSALSLVFLTVGLILGGVGKASDSTFPPCSTAITAADNSIITLHGIISAMGNGDGATASGMMTMYTNMYEKDYSHYKQLCLNK